MEDRLMKHIDLLVERYPSLESAKEDIIAAYEVLEESYKNGGKLLVAGNGGSAADAEHIVGELMKGFKLPRKPKTDFAEKLMAENQELGAVLAENLQGALPAIALDGHPALSTAYMNDCEPLLCFAQQVNGYGKAGDDEHMGVFLELKGAGSRNMEYVLQAQNRDWYSFLNRCLDCGGVIRRFDLAINDMCGLLDIPTLSEKYKNGGADCRCKNYENVQGGKLSGKNRNLASTLYIGSKSSTKYFCLYEKQKEQATKKKHTDIINRFEIRLRDKKAVQAVEELLLTYNPHGLVFYLITDFVEFPDYPLWEIFISHDNLPFEMNPVPVNMERTLQWLERQVMPSIVMIEEIDRLTGSNYMKMIDECTHLSEKQEMLVEQMCTDIADVIESEGVFYA